MPLAIPGRGLIAACALALVLGACGDDENVDPNAGKPAQQIFDEAEAAMADGQEVEAAQLFDDVERLYPYSQLAKRAMLRSAMAYYQAQQFTEARLAAERYLDFFPADEEAPFAQYLVALTYYDVIADVGRDQAATRNARQALRETMQRYPDSEFAREAALKLDLTENNLAGKEMTVGRYYLKRGHYVAAVNRFRNVLQRHQTTSHAPEALHRLVEAYLALGLETEARNAAAVLGHNFPGSEWYADSYALLTGEDLTPEEDEESWISRTFRRVAQGDWL